MQNRLTIVAVPIGTVVDFSTNSRRVPPSAMSVTGLIFSRYVGLPNMELYFSVQYPSPSIFIREHEHRQSEREYHNNNHGDPEPQHKPNYAGIKT